MRMMRLRVDPVACDAFGYCAELLPEMVGLDEWGYPVLADGVVPPPLLDLARRAVRDCPRRALFLEAAERQGSDGARVSRGAVLGAGRSAGGNRPHARGPHAT